jgi:chorismate dehydratase
MHRLQISAISFLNTAPLMWDFEHGGASADFEISYTLPSGCADALAEGAADIGIIPAFAYASIPGLVILPNVAIASKRAVRSILLVSKVPIGDIRTVAADTSSRTSVALLRLLFEKWFGGAREMVPMAPDPEIMLNRCDAALLIGDAALLVDRSRYLTYDLAEEWNRLTGKPFVFAFWAVRLEALKMLRPGLDLAKVFQLSRDHGLQPQNLSAIAQQWSPRVHMTEPEVISYLTYNIDYNLDAANLEGMELFFRHAVECGVVPEAPVFRFLGSLGCSLAIAGMR